MDTSDLSQFHFPANPPGSDIYCIIGELWIRFRVRSESPCTGARPDVASSSSQAVRGAYLRLQ